MKYWSDFRSPPIWPKCPLLADSGPWRAASPRQFIGGNRTHLHPPALPSDRNYLLRSVLIEQGAIPAPNPRPCPEIAASHGAQ